MTARQIARHSIAALLATLLAGMGMAHPALGASCDPGGGIGGTGITGFGVVQRFGSIFVNGREFCIDQNTQVTRNGQPSDAKSLRLGDVVKVRGFVNAKSGHSVATRVVSTVALSGIVEKVNSRTGTFTVLGQEVYVTPTTLSGNADNAPLDLSRIRVNESVRISGLMRSDGSWTATRVSRNAPGAGFLLNAVLQGVDQERGEFRIGGRTFTADRAALPARADIGKTVRVEGHYTAGVPRIDTVKADATMFVPADHLVEMSGYVQARAGQQTLMSNDVALKLNGAPTFVSGSAADIAKDTPIAVRGEVQHDGSVLVREIVVDVEPMRVVLPDQGPPLTPGHNDGPSHGRPADEGGRDRPDTERVETDRHDSGTPERPEFHRREIGKPDIERPEIERPSVERPEINRPEVEKPEDH